MSETAQDALYPILPLRDIVVFPHMIVPLFVGREKSVRALEDVMQDNKRILLVAQRNGLDEDPGTGDLHRTGTVGTVLQLLKLPDGTVKVLVEGGVRARITAFVDNNRFMQARAEIVLEQANLTDEVEALARAVRDQFGQYAKLNRKLPPEVLVSLNQIEEPGRLADSVASHLSLKIADKQKILAAESLSDRLRMVSHFIDSENGILKVEKRIRGRVKRQMEKTQREYYLTEQMKAIRKELGEGEDGRDEFAELEERIRKTRLSKAAREKARAEVRKLRSMGPTGAEATVVRTYLDWLLGIPWKKKRTRVGKDIHEAEAVLNADHYGLEKVKERILEYLAVQQRMSRLRGPILCLVGPPGVGKTSLGQSIAAATGRSFVRMSLGGVRDEAEIRGHRRTYVGALPGKIIQGMKKAKTSNPLFLLDEVDKLGSDWRGDPASALLEVLDPEQNSTFQDHYLEVDYDLSGVMFVCTANTLRMPQALLDRMETIRLAGYTEEEKIQIGRRHLLPKQVSRHGLRDDEWSLSDGALCDLIRHYTREAGVRNLERELANLARKAVKEIDSSDAVASVRVTSRNLRRYAGVRRFRFGEVEKKDMVGVVTALAWTDVGGELLSAEAITVPGKGRMSVTGKLGDVMQESVQAANAYVRARAVDFGIEPTVFGQRDIHVHVPEGAVPKDGPSAGVAMITAMVSALTGIPVRRDVAMTGEITLRGRVLPIGGLKEKLLAARRGGLARVLIPKDNEKDLAEIADSVKKQLTIVPVQSVDEVLERALSRTLVPIEWLEPDGKRPPVDPDGKHVGAIRH